MTTPEQPYFVVRVTRCAECPHLRETSHSGTYCGGPTNRSRFTTYEENIDGITPTCPMWPQRVEPPKD